MLDCVTCQNRWQKKPFWMQWGILVRILVFILAFFLALKSRWHWLPAESTWWGRIVCRNVRAALWIALSALKCDHAKAINQLSIAKEKRKSSIKVLLSWQCWPVWSALIKGSWVVKRSQPSQSPPPHCLKTRRTKFKFNWHAFWGSSIAFSFFLFCV